MSKCKYCDIDNMMERYDDVYYNIINSERYSSLNICYLKDKDTWLLEACGDDESMREINFCPFCGRQLNKSYKAIR